MKRETINNIINLYYKGQELATTYNNSTTLTEKLDNNNKLYENNQQFLDELLKLITLFYN